MRAFSTGCSYLLNCGLSPSAGLEVVKKSLWICIACQKSALQQIDNSSDNLIVFFLSGSGNCRLDLAKRQAELQNSTSQYGVNMGLVTLVWVNYGFNTVQYGINMGLVRLNTAKIQVLGICWVRTLKLQSKITKKCNLRFGFWMILFIFSISLIDFVRFCQSRTFFGNEKMQLFQLFQIYASRGGSCVGKSPPTTPDQIEGDHKQCCPTCSKSIGPFLVRTASQSQRVGSMINMKGTERDRSKASTSSTAQGGGGSFKNRKPIGEIGCCESWMAERIH